MKTTNNHIQYLGSSSLDEKWGLTVTTVGYQRIPAHSTYPSVTQDILNLLPASDKRSKPEPCY